ncbi:MAG: tetratricopeptide repeat protein [Candidatus Melainabacteria bacterium]|nr:tetratricopeptide repeat protein [Candidatus Melainabacteria bacterium]
MKVAFTGLVLSITVLLATGAPVCADDAAFRSLMDAGVVALKESKYADAHKNFSDALQVAEDHHNDGYISLSTARLADLLQRQKKYGEAEPLFKRSLSFAEKTKDPGSRLKIMSLNGLGTLYLAQKNYGQAEIFLKRVLSMVEKANDPDNDNRFLPTILDNLAVVYRAQKKFSAAEALYKRAIPMWEQVAGPEDTDTATSINNLAALYYYQRKYAEAEPLFKRSLAIREKTLGLNHPEVINNANNLILVYRAEKKLAEAKELSKRFSEANEKSDGQSFGILTGAGVDTSEWTKYIQAGRLHLREGKYEEAQQELEAAVKEAEKGGVEDKRLAASLYNLGHVYAKQHRIEQAEAAYKRSLYICEKVSGDNDTEVLRTLTSLAKLYTEQRKFDQAEPMFKHVLGVQEKTLGRKHQEVKETLAELKTMYTAAGKNAEVATIDKRLKNIEENRAREAAGKGGKSANNLK